MRQVGIYFERMNEWETLVTGLRAGYLLVTAEMLPDVIRASQDGLFFPYLIETRIPDYDEPEKGIMGLAVELIPFLKPPTTPTDD